MNDIQVFSSEEFGQIRTVTIEGNPWFIAKDLSEILGYAQTNHMKRLIDEDDYSTIDPQSAEFSGFLQNGTTLEPNKNIRILSIVNESGLYAAIFGSQLPNAKKFKKWVTSEVLPSIRKHGAYTFPQTTQGQIQLLAQGYTEMREEVDSIRTDLETLKMDLPILPVEADRITEAVRKKGVSILGGKQSKAYNERGLRQRVYNNLYSNLKYNFGVRSYKSIKRCQCDKAIEIINNYQVPFFLAEQIAQVNAQQTMEM